MNNIMATYLLVDNKENSTRVGNVRGKTSSKRVQDVYWKCVLCQYLSINTSNTNVKKMFFTNLKESPIVDGINIYDKLNELEVEIVIINFNNKMPDLWSDSWTNQFFMFDILEYMNNTYVGEFKFLLLDSDCIISDNIDMIFNDIERFNFICYDMKSSMDQNINGVTGKTITKFYNYIYNDNISRIKMIGGEFIGLNRKGLSEFLTNYYIIRKEAINAFNNERERPVTEEHFFSLISNRINGFTNHNYIKRISLFKNYNNYEKNDENFPIWHLPSEKTRGFYIMFKRYSKNTKIHFSKKILIDIFIRQSLYKDIIQFKEKIILRISDSF